MDILILEACLLLLLFFSLFWFPLEINIVIGIISLLGLRMVMRKVTNKLHEFKTGWPLLYRISGSVLLVFTLVAFIATFNDLDADSLSMSREWRLGLCISSSDSDKDIMKDGVELKTKDKSLFDPLDPDIKGDDISDFCNAIIRHKKINDKYFSELSKTGLSNFDKIRNCDLVLNTFDNFRFCSKIKNNVSVLLNMRCKDIAFGNIAKMREKRYPPTYEITKCKTIF